MHEIGSVVLVPDDSDRSLVGRAVSDFTPSYAGIACPVALEPWMARSEDDEDTFFEEDDGFDDDDDEAFDDLDDLDDDYDDDDEEEEEDLGGDVDDLG